MCSTGCSRDFKQPIKTAMVMDNITKDSCPSPNLHRWSVCLVGSNHEKDGVFFPKCDFSLGIGLDSCVIPIRHGGLFLVQSTAFFYPLVDDPYVMVTNEFNWNSFEQDSLQGKIACANVLSDVYAMGAVEVDNMLMLLSTSNKMSEKERDTIMPLVLQGFKVRSKTIAFFTKWRMIVRNVLKRPEQLFKVDKPSLIPGWLLVVWLLLFVHKMKLSFLKMPLSAMC